MASQKGNYDYEPNVFDPPSTSFSYEPVLSREDGSHLCILLHKVDPVGFADNLDLRLQSNKEMPLGMNPLGKITIPQSPPRLVLQILNDVLRSVP